VVEINRFVSQHFRDALDHSLDPGSRSERYPGRPVMVLRIDYVLKLFNGDVGIVLPDASDTLMVYFPERDGSFRAVAPLRLPEQRFWHARRIAENVTNSPRFFSRCSLSGSASAQHRFYVPLPARRAPRWLTVQARPRSRSQR